MSRSTHPVRRCAPCDIDWPNISAYNLCPRCQRNTFASTADERPDYPAAHAEAKRFERVREFDAKCDAAAETVRLEWAAEMDALLGLTKSTAPPATNAQDVRYPWQAPDA